MARIEAQTVWTVTDEAGSNATVEVFDDPESGPRLEIEQGDDKVWLNAEALPKMIEALQAALASRP